MLASDLVTKDQVSRRNLDDDASKSENSQQEIKYVKEKPLL
jgi:hypothetical protein